MALEYPEMKQIASQMAERLPGRSVTRVSLRDPSISVFRWGFCNLDQVDITGQLIVGIRHFGDNIFIQLSDWSVVLGDMIGRWLYHAPDEQPPVKAAVTFSLDDGAAVSYNPTLYGWCKAVKREEENHFAKETWVEPLSPDFTPQYLARAFNEPVRKIAKQINVFDVVWKVAGVGIGYWQEILYRAGVNPQRKSKEITDSEFRDLHKNTIDVITQAVTQQGSFDEVDFLGKSGGYVRQMGGRWNGLPCPKCGTTIVGKPILGAKVYFCPNCQK